MICIVPSHKFTKPLIYIHKGGFQVSRQNVLRSTLLLTLSGIVAKTIDFVFRAYYSQKLGSEGMGIFSLTFSIHSIMLTFATGGLGVAVSKIVSEQYASRSFDKIKKTMQIALTSVTILSAVVILVTSSFTKEISTFFLKEERCEKSILYISPSIFFMGISYCIKGYFYASRRIFPPASSEFLEQAVKIISIRLLLEKWLPHGIEHGCEAVFLGLSIGELSSCLYLSLFYLFAQMRLPKAFGRQKILRQILKIACPSMLTSLLSSFLRMKESVWIVEGLQKSGLGHTAALSEYGIIHGMVMPLIVFPLTLLSSCFTLIVPEISRAAGCRNSLRLKTLTARMYRFAAFFGFLILSVYFTFSENLLELVYRKPIFSPILKTLALLCPIMFMDSLSSSLLSGLGKQGSLLIFSLSDSIVRLTLIYVLTPLLGKDALIIMIAISNIFTFALSSGKVRKSIHLIFEMPKNLIRPCICSFLAFLVASIFIKQLPSSPIPLILGILGLSLVFTAFCIQLRAVEKQDAAWLFSRMFS